MSDIQLIAFDSAARVPFGFDGRIIYSGERFELVHLALNPGEGMEMHSQPFDVLFFVVAGTGTLKVGDDIVHVKVNDSVSVPKGVLRAWSNRGAETFRVLVCKLKDPAPGQ